MNRFGIEEVEFNHIIAPLVEDDIKEMFDVLTNLGVVHIDCVGAVPGKAAPFGRALFVQNQPVGMLVRGFGNALNREGGNPDAREIALLMNSVGNRFHAAGEFYRVNIEPVAYEGLIAVVNLENRNILFYFVEPVEIAKDNLFIDFLEVVVP